MNRVEKYCPQCLKKCEVESLGIIGLFDGSTIYVYRCKECFRIFREKQYKIIE